MAFDFSFDANGVTLSLKPEKQGLLSGLLRRQRQRDLTRLPPDDRALLVAVADLKALAAERGDDSLVIDAQQIRLSHALAAALDGASAAMLGLPPMVDLTLATDAEGIVGSPNFRLRYRWLKNGKSITCRREGAIVTVGDSPKRLPVWMMGALDIADGFSPGTDLTSHWAALGRFREALDPGVTVGAPTQAARSSMSDFLARLTVRVADRFAIAADANGDDFEVVPFSGRHLQRDGYEADALVPEAASELEGDELTVFQARVVERGALPAYRLSPGSYLVVDKAAAPALDVMARKRQASVAERRAFIRNPRADIAAAIEASLRASGDLDGLSPEAEEEAIEAAAAPLFVETEEFSERVKGIKVFEKANLDIGPGSGTTWLPEVFTQTILEALATATTQEVRQLTAQVAEAVASGETSVPFSGVDVPARPETQVALEAEVRRREFDEAAQQDYVADIEQRQGPIVLDAETNFEELTYLANVKPRQAVVAEEVPAVIRTPLKAHQVDSFHWQLAAWKAGLPGVLNADEQGLGKTLQTIAFIAWLKANMAKAGGAAARPVLIVAPTSLLRNWEKEVQLHVEEPGFGSIVRLYGASVAARKAVGAHGKDTDRGEQTLDLSSLHEAIADGRAHRYWVLTTYTTLTNYQHSLARIPFAAGVFDEIQAIKNPDSLRAIAAEGMKLDFRIGLTGTPIENSTIDLWAIMDKIAPGWLGTLKDFRDRYAAPDEASMRDLHERVFRSQRDLPPLALRRLKDEVARDLPAKSRRLHPRLMPNRQAAVYEEARVKLAEGGLGAALKMLHHIRAVSVHPALDADEAGPDFIQASARLKATFDILRRIRQRDERALVFIEHRRMQYRFIELVKAEFGLDRVDLINGDTPIPQRQAIVDRFQGEAGGARGFDLLVLGPKAAGTGLTLTAATHVIHLSRWWNPAVEEQCNDRVHRIGQTRPVTVHLPMAIHPGYRENSFDCLLHSLMQRKRHLAAAALWPMGDDGGDVAALQQGLQSQQSASAADPVWSAIGAMFKRDGVPLGEPDADGSVAI
ncbi:DEAD/DEAH box helicase [Oryzibacter oryziterrae]|uniref:DEAD/DEAH box helicase n=1 Tax=Oryzibacter oryziterrae TaxID=2766474 RepID=UPI001F2633C6|nr:DEAD/DEAH box helicase [Oryzibacter oryziterrae]